MNYQHHSQKIEQTSISSQTMAVKRNIEEPLAK